MNARAFSVDAALGARWPEFLAALEQASRTDAELAALGFLECCFDVVVGEKVAGFRFSEGKAFEVKDKSANPAFALTAPHEVWKKFFAAVPPPFYHAVYAMKMRVPVQGHGR